MEAKYEIAHIVGENNEFLQALETACKISPTEASVLITGESGTGKELIAEAIHLNSQRRNAPFVKVNLAGISASLFESEMFGHVKGAFTDAKADRVGRFELAHGGTIFLDEIGDLDLNSQVKLLRVLQERRFERLGSSQTIDADFRLIAATNRDLEDMVSRAEFREDLYYRINLIRIKIPALRDRRDDIPRLINSYLNNLKSIYQRPHLRMQKAAMQKLAKINWPGNVRELKNLVERSVLINRSDQIELDEVMDLIDSSPKRRDTVALPDIGSMTLEEMERSMIEKALDFHEGNISKVARSLGLSRAALYRRLEKFGLEP